MKNTLHTKLFIIMILFGSLPALASAEVTLLGDAAINTNLLETNVQSETSVQVGSESNAQNDNNFLLDLGVNADIYSGDDDDDHDDNHNHDNAHIDSSVQVQSKSDLDIFVDTLEDHNSAVVDIETEAGVNNNATVVTYKHKARLLGFIPVGLNSKTTLSSDSDGHVVARVRLPWWSFLTTGKNVNSTSLESQMNARLKANTNAAINASAQAKAELIEKITAELKVHAQAQAQAQVK